MTNRPNTRRPFRLPSPLLLVIIFAMAYITLMEVNWWLQHPNLGFHTMLSL